MNLDVKFGELSRVFRFDFSEIECQFSASLDDVVVVPVLPQDIEIYAGEYDVTPKVNEQSLSTAEKFMKQDVTIRAIPYFDVSNAAGGSTIYIGMEV